MILILFSLFPLLFNSVARPLWTTDLIPLADAIAHMRYKCCLCERKYCASISQFRATYFSQSPTDKMYSVVSSAKALYDSIGTRSERIDGGRPRLESCMTWVHALFRYIHGLVGLCCYQG